MQPAFCVFLGSWRRILHREAFSLKRYWRPQDRATKCKLWYIPSAGGSINSQFYNWHNCSGENHPFPRCLATWVCLGITRVCMVEGGYATKTADGVEWRPAAVCPQIKRPPLLRDRPQASAPGVLSWQLCKPWPAAHSPVLFTDPSAAARDLAVWSHQEQQELLIQSPKHKEFSSLTLHILSANLQRLISSLSMINWLELLRLTLKIYGVTLACEPMYYKITEGPLP